MHNLNSILIEGILVVDPEYTKSKNGMTVGKFIIRSNYHYKKDKEVYHFNVIINGSLAENAKPILLVEAYVRVIGRLSEEDGNVTIIADHVEIKPSIIRDKI